MRAVIVKDVIWLISRIKTPREETIQLKPKSNGTIGNKVRGARIAKEEGTIEKNVIATNRTAKLIIVWKSADATFTTERISNGKTTFLT